LKNIWATGQQCLTTQFLRETPLPLEMDKAFLLSLKIEILELLVRQDRHGHFRNIPAGMSDSAALSHSPAREGILTPYAGTWTRRPATPARGGRSVIWRGCRVTNRMPSSRKAGDPVRVAPRVRVAVWFARVYYFFWVNGTAQDSVLSDGFAWCSVVHVLCVLAES
jgi:hypothetical protein